MSYQDAKQQLNMMLRNGQISEQQYCDELKSLEYAYCEAMTNKDDQLGVSA